LVQNKEKLDQDKEKYDSPDSVFLQYEMCYLDNLWI